MGLVRIEIVKFSTMDSATTTVSSFREESFLRQIVKEDKVLYASHSPMHTHTHSHCSHELPCKVLAMWYCNLQTASNVNGKD